jgi:hypothetical protein
MFVSALWPGVPCGSNYLGLTTASLILVFSWARSRGFFQTMGPVYTYVDGFAYLDSVVGLDNSGSGVSDAL